MPEERNLDIDVLETIQRFLEGIETSQDALKNYMNVIKTMEGAFRDFNKLYAFQIPPTLYYMGTPEINLRTLMNTVFGVQERVGKVMGSFFSSFDPILNQIYQYEIYGQEYKTQPVQQLQEQLRQLSLFRNLLERKIRVREEIGLDIPFMEIAEGLNYRNVLPRDELISASKSFSDITRNFRNYFASLQTLFQSTRGIQAFSRQDIKNILPTNILENINRIIRSYGLQEQLQEEFNIDRITEVSQLTPRLGRWLAKQISQVENIGERITFETTGIQELGLGREFINVLNQIASGNIIRRRGVRQLRITPEIQEALRTGDIERVLREIYREYGQFTERGIYRQVGQLLSLLRDIQNINIEEIPVEQRGNIVNQINTVRREIATAINNILRTGGLENIDNLVRNIQQSFGQYTQFQTYQRFTNEFNSKFNEINRRVNEELSQRFENMFNISNYLDRVIQQIEQGTPLHQAIFEAIPFEDIATNLARVHWEKNKRFYQILGSRFRDEQTFINEFVRKFMEQRDRYINRFTEYVQEETLRRLAQPYVTAFGPITGIYEAIRDIGTQGIKPQVLDRLLAQSSHQVLQDLHGVIQERLAPIQRILQQVENRVTDTGQITPLHERIPLFSRIYQQINQYSSMINSLSKVIDIGTDFEVAIRAVPEFPYQDIKNLLGEKIRDLNERRLQILSEMSKSLGKPVSGIAQLIGKNIEEIGFEDIRNLIEKNKDIKRRLSDDILNKIFLGYQEERALGTAYLQTEFIDIGTPVADIRQVRQNLVERGQELLSGINQYMSAIFQRINRRVPMMDIGMDVIGGLDIGPEFVDVNMQFVKNIGRGGLSFQQFQTLTSKLEGFLNTLQMPQLAEGLRNSVEAFRNNLKAYKKTLEEITNITERGERLESPATTLYQRVYRNENLRRFFEGLGVSFEGVTERSIPMKNIETFAQKIRELFGFDIGDIQVGNKEQIKDRINAINRQISNMFDVLNEIETGKASVRTRVETFFRTLGEGIMYAEHFMTRPMAWVMTMPAMSPMWMIGMQPTMYAMQTTMPIYHGIGGLTGLPTLYTEIMRFGMMLPMFLQRLQEQFVTISTLMRSRTAGFGAISTALEIARWQPIQFEEAVQTIMAFSIYPETRTAIRSPLFQRQVLETVQLLSMLVPEQGIEGAIFAIRELLGNQFRSIERRFNISRELLASYAGVTMEEFKDLSGVEKLRALHRGLTELFVGGEEVLLQRGFMFDVQIRNIIDTLIRSIVRPLAMITSPTVQERLYSLTTQVVGIKGGREQYAVEFVVPEIYQRYRHVAERYFREMKPEERRRIEERIIERLPEERRQEIINMTEERRREEINRMIIENITRQIFVTQNATIAGQLSTVFAFLNQSIGTLFDRIDVAGAISDFLGRLFTPMFGGGEREGFIPRWTQRIQELERINAPTEVWRRTFLEFVGDLSDTILEGLNEFNTIMSGEVRTVIRKLVDTVSEVSMTALEPIASIAMKSGFKLMMRFPEMIGEVIVGAVTPEKQIQNIRPTPFQYLGENVENIVKMTSFVGLMTALMNPQFGMRERIGYSLVATMMPRLIQDTTGFLKGEVEPERYITELGLGVLGFGLINQRLQQGLREAFGQLPELININRLETSLESISTGELRFIGSGLVRSAGELSGVIRQLSTHLSRASRILTGVTLLPVVSDVFRTGLGAVKYTMGRTEEAREDLSLDRLIRIGGFAGGYLIARRFANLGGRLSFLGESPLMTGLMAYYSINDIVDAVTSLYNIMTETNKGIDSGINNYIQNLRKRIDERRRLISSITRLVGTGIGLGVGIYTGQPFAGALIGGTIGETLSRPITDIATQDIRQQLIERIRQRGISPITELELIKERQRGIAEVRRFREIFGFELPTRIYPRGGYTEIIKPEEFIPEEIRIPETPITTPTMTIQRYIPLREMVSTAFERFHRNISNYAKNTLTRMFENIYIQEHELTYIPTRTTPIRTPREQLIPQALRFAGVRTEEVISKLTETGELPKFEEAYKEVIKEYTEKRRLIASYLKKQSKEGISIDPSKLDNILNQILRGEITSETDIENRLSNILSQSAVADESVRERIITHLKEQLMSALNVRKTAVKQIESMFSKIGLKNINVENLFSQMSVEDFTRVREDMTNTIRALNDWIRSGGGIQMIRHLALREFTVPELPTFPESGEINFREYAEKLQRYRQQLLENFKVGTEFLTGMRGFVLMGALAGAKNPFEDWQNIMRQWVERMQTGMVAEPQVALQFMRNPQLLSQMMLALPHEQFTEFVTQLYQTLRTSGQALYTREPLQTIQTINTSTMNVNASTVNITTGG